MENIITINKATSANINAMIEIEQSAAELFSILPLFFLMKLPKDIPNHDVKFYQSMINADTSWVISVGEQIAGFICTAKITPENTLHIYEFDVAKIFQGQGLGRMLLDFVIDFCYKNSISKLTLTTFIDVPWNAPFYREYGFSIIAKANLYPRLRDILQHEIELGFPEETRCAMELNLIKNQLI